MASLMDIATALAILALLIVIAARLDRAETRITQGTAIVNDGDSITIGTERIRLRGIDAPEYAQICRKDGADYTCGRTSRDTLRNLVAGGPVSCEGWERDRYRRLLALCKAGDIELNRRQVLEGWAVAYGDFEAEERQARDRRSGMWAGEFDRPRQWRDQHGGMAESEHDMVGAVLNWLHAILRFF